LTLGTHGITPWGGLTAALFRFLDSPAELRNTSGRKPSGGPMNTSNPSPSRRQFLQTAAAASIAPMVLPSGVLAQGGRPGANDGLVLGHIRVGGMGAGDVSFVMGCSELAVAAVCDVDQNHLARARDISGGKADTYVDYREILERKDIDAVIIAAPDHWHG